LDVTECSARLVSTALVARGVTQKYIRIESPANSPQKLARPGFGPAAELPCAAQASRRHAACIARLTCKQAARRSGFGPWALAAQLSVWAVRRTRTRWPLAASFDRRKLAFERV